MCWSLSEDKCHILSWRLRCTSCLHSVVSVPNVICTDLWSEPQLQVKGDVRTPFWQAAPHGGALLLGGCLCWTKGFGVNKTLLVASLLSGGKILQVPSFFLRDYQTTGQINYSHFRDQSITLGVLKIFCKCWPYLSTLCSLAPEINGRHNSQKTGISFTSCSISLPWEHNGLFCDWKVHFYFLPSFLPGLKLLQVPSIQFDRVKTMKNEEQGW